MARSGVYLWSRLVALRSRSTPLSKSLLFKASAPSRASLFASMLPFACFASLPPCACAICETQTVTATIKVRVEYFFIAFYWTLIFLENSKLILQTVGRKPSLRLLGRRRLFNVDLWLGLRCCRRTRSWLIDASNAHGASCGLINFDERSAQAHLTA